MSRGPTVADLAAFAGGAVVGDDTVRVDGVSDLEHAESTQLSFVVDPRHAELAETTSAGALLVGEPLDDATAPQIVVANPKLALARIAAEFFVKAAPPSGIADSAVLGADVSLGEDVTIGACAVVGDRVRIGRRVRIGSGTVVGDDVVLGDDTVLHARVSVRDDCELGARVVVHDGTVIGADGFGYVQDGGRHVKVPQLGRVVIEDDVEIGANAAIDRATFGETRIRRGSKIDNLVQIAHNVEIGEDSIIVAQVGISGSCRIGSNVMIGGQAGIADHTDIGDRVLIAARTGLNRDIPSDQAFSGVPAMPHRRSIMAQAVIPRLPELRRQVQELTKRLNRLEGVDPSD